MSVPKKAYLPGVGMVRVLQFESPHHFRVLDNQDFTRLVHRDRLSFRR